MKKNFIVPNPEQIEYVIGIDFGHGETSAAITRIDCNDDPEDIDITGTGQKVIPSAMHISPTGDITIGKGASKLYAKYGGDFYAYFKQSPDTLDEQRNSNLKIMKLFMKSVYETICYRHSGELMEGSTIKQNHVVFIACPSKSQKWDDQAMQNYVQLALDAGLPIAGVSIDGKFTLSGIVRESRAAYIRMLQKDEAAQKSKEGILVVDYGSSTIDITYYKEDENPIDKGYELGAQIVEKNILNHLKKWHDELGSEQAPTVLETIENQDIPRYTDLLFKIRAAKEIYYTSFDSNTTCVDDMEVRYGFPATYAPAKLDVFIAKETIDKILEDYIKQVKNAFIDFKNNVIGEKTVTLLVLTGGASRMNFVRPLAQEVFGKQARLLPPQDSSLTVSNGIATAGRADIKLYYMALEFFSNSKMVDSNTLIQDVAKKIADNVINKMSICYENFKNQSSSDSIVSLKAAISTTVGRQSNSYNVMLQQSFNKTMQSYINSAIKEKLRMYTKEYFPYLTISSMKDREIKNIAINVPVQSLEAFGKVIDDSVKQIEDKALIVAIKAIWDFAALGIAGVIKLYFELIGGGINAFKRFWAWLNDQKYDTRNDVEAPSFDDVYDVFYVKFNDKDTKLNKDQRIKVYNGFNNGKESYERLLTKNIIRLLENHVGINNEIKKMSKELIEQYIIDEINRIQLQIK